MLAPRILFACALMSCVVAAVSCNASKAQDAPKQKAAWTGRPGNLTEWGHGADYIYGLLATPHSGENRLVVWKWQEGIMKEATAAALPSSMDVVPLSDKLCGLSLDPKNKFAAWPYALLDMSNDGKIVHKWNPPAGWYFPHAGGSMNGKVIALLAKEGVDAPGHSWERPRMKVGLIDVPKKELRWVGELQGHGAGTIRRVVVTDDGRYIAIAGWNNGTAMVDAKEGKVLWGKRPEHEVSTGYAAFAPNGKLVYTAGSEGCVYGLEVATGNTVSRRWATSTGESIYGHRISALAISDDGKRLVAGTGPEGEVYVWSLEGNDKPRVIQHGKGTINIVAFSPDAKRIVSVGAGMLKVWQLTSAASQGSLP